MQHGSKHFGRFSKSAVSGLLIVLILMLDAMAACPALHEMVHKDADSPNHHCAVTTLAQGKVSAAHCEIVIPPPSVVVETERHFTFAIFSPAIENLPPGRAPPAPSVVS